MPPYCIRYEFSNSSRKQPSEVLLAIPVLKIAQFLEKRFLPNSFLRIAHNFQNSYFEEQWFIHSDTMLLATQTSFMVDQKLGFSRNILIINIYKDCSTLEGTQYSPYIMAQHYNRKCQEKATVPPFSCFLALLYVISGMIPQ